MLKNTFWFSFLAAIQNPAVGVRLLNCSKVKVMRTTNSWWILDLSKRKTLSPVTEELVLQFEPWSHWTSLSFLASKGITTSLRAYWNVQYLLRTSAELLVTVVVMIMGFLAAHGCSDFLFSKAFLTYTLTLPALLPAHKKEEKWKMPAGSFASSSGEEKER